MIGLKVRDPLFGQANPPTSYVAQIRHLERLKVGRIRLTSAGRFGRHPFAAAGFPSSRAQIVFFNLMNSEDRFAQLTVTPHRKLTLRSEAHSLNLANSEDLWYIGGGAFQKGTFGYTGRPSGGHKRFTAVFDLSADYQFDEQTTFTVYVAHAPGKAVVRSIFPDGPNANFAYVAYSDDVNRLFRRDVNKSERRTLVFEIMLQIIHISQPDGAGERIRGCSRCIISSPLRGGIG